MSGRVTVLTGGVGGAKLVLGLCHLLPGDEVTAIVNTGDDFIHLGLAISPDIDTLLYTLAGKANAAQGWGREVRAGVSWRRYARFADRAGLRWATVTSHCMCCAPCDCAMARRCPASLPISRLPGGSSNDPADEQ